MNQCNILVVKGMKNSELQPDHSSGGVSDKAEERRVLVSGSSSDGELGSAFSVLMVMVRNSLVRFHD